MSSIITFFLNWTNQRKSSLIEALNGALGRKAIAKIETGGLVTGKTKTVNQIDGEKIGMGLIQRCEGLHLLKR